ncbi:hypothetical protein DFH06DRAFT_1329755 [Mycena polygramma]|nr:hypothetical protein DFH06DRAFT_1329755 [Mycena polygramma]
MSRRLRSVPPRAGAVRKVCLSYTAYNVLLGAADLKWLARTGDSCIRCDRKELNCTEESSSVHTAPPPIDPDPVSPERARAACQNCRNDSKKCDNQRPCTRCVARSETCVPFPRGTKQTKTRCEGCRKRNIRCEDARPWTRMRPPREGGVH